MENTAAIMSNQAQLNITLTGIMRHKMVIEWIKRGRPGDKEDFVQTACEALGLIYTQPPVLGKRR